MSGNGDKGARDGQRVGMGMGIGDNDDCGGRGEVGCVKRTATYLM